MTKLFECFWGDGYRDTEGKATLAYHNEEFFNENKGYEPHDIEDINLLNIGESINLSCITGEHWVQRIK